MPFAGSTRRRGTPLASRRGPVTTDLRGYAVEEILRDGRSIHIRAIRSDDRERLADHFQYLSARSVDFRFMGMKRHLSEADLDYFTRVDFVCHVSLVATLRDGAAEQIIDVGRYVVRDPSCTAAEVAFAVTDEYQGRGVGTLLLEHLLRIARERGITEFPCRRPRRQQPDA
jgi:GNAT superfamily N-acetyltransferase